MESVTLDAAKLRMPRYGNEPDRVLEMLDKIDTFLLAIAGGADNKEACAKVKERLSFVNDCYHKFSAFGSVYQLAKNCRANGRQSAVAEQGATKEPAPASEPSPAAPLPPPEMPVVNVINGSPATTEEQQRFEEINQFKMPRTGKEHNRQVGTYNRIDIFLAAICAGNSKNEALDKVMATRAAFSNWGKEYPSFEMLYDKARIYRNHHGGIKSGGTDDEREKPKAVRKIRSAEIPAEERKAAVETVHAALLSTSQKKLDDAATARMREILLTPDAAVAYLKENMSYNGLVALAGKLANWLEQQNLNAP